MLARRGGPATVAVNRLKTNPSADVSASLRRLRQRLLARLVMDAAATGALAGAAGGLLIAVYAQLVLGWALPFWVFGLALALGAALCALPELARPWSLEKVAALADVRGQTKERFTTALALAGSGGRLEALARQECAAWLAQRDFRPLVPLHPPRAGRWLVVPLLAFGFLQLDFGRQRTAALAEAALAQEMVAETAAQLEQLARQAEQAGGQARDEELQNLAEQLRQSAGRLRAETSPAEAPKAALRELSAMEAALRELQRQPSSVEEMKELAKALAALPGMQEVLDALSRNDLAAAQAAMEKAREEQAAGRSEAMTEEQAERNLQQAMQRLADRRRLSQALQKLAEQMKQNPGGGTQAAMQQLAQMLQQQAQQQGDGGQGRQMTLQEMIAALENMKFGDGQDNPQQAGGNQQAGGKPVIVQSFGQPDPGSDPQPGGAQAPSGRPGSERDFGTTEHPFGAKSEAQDKGGEFAAKGRLGEGETLSMMLPSAGDQSRSARRYQDLYEAAAAAAQDSIEQEDIPLGSRFLIKRYFEGIRPKE